ncbi:hypothetical protein [Sphingomonas aerolata]|uniref:hypothetical protein n=1 Tax=Sphingomonas aerolata TaxID=185951 RepID=UPI002FDFD7B6
MDRAYSVLLMVLLPTSVVQTDNGIEACEALGSEDPYKPPADLIIGGCVKREGWLAAAAPLSGTGLTDPPQTLPITYGWMMGYPPGWLATALISAMAKGSLRPASSSRRSATPSFRNSPKPLAEPF